MKERSAERRKKNGGACTGGTIGRGGTVGAGERTKKKPRDPRRWWRADLPGRIGEWAGPLLWVAGTFLCERWGVAVMLLTAVAIHECGHLAAFVLMGEPTPALRVGRLGLTLRAKRPLSPGRELLAAAAGPGANLLCAALLAAGGGSTPAALHLLTALGNLLPIGELDGARILGAVWERLLPPDAAYRLGRGISLCVLVGGMTAALVCLWCFGGGGYAYFLLFSLFMEHIITDKAAAEPVR